MELEPSTRHSCLKLEVQLDGERPEKEAFFVKGTWFAARFELLITDGLRAWTCSASEAELRQRADQWDQPLSEYLALAERYLGYQQPGSRYAFEEAGNGHRRLSWTFEKQGTKLEWRWKCKPSSDNRQTTAAILDFLMDANIRLSEEVVRKTQLSDKLEIEAKRCLMQTEKLTNEKAEFESAIYSKFVAVLNSKKAKLRDLRDQISKRESSSKSPLEGDDSTDKTESFDEASDEDEKIEEEPVEESVTHEAGASDKAPVSSLKGRTKRSRRLFPI